MAKGLLDLLLASIFNEEWKGRYGEKLTERELKFTQLLGKKGRVLRNVYVPKENGETSEIDLLFITQKGIFVFESKNYSGWIFGDEKSTYWTMMLPNKQKNSFYNPIKQNKTHIKWLGNYLEQKYDINVPLYSIIVFSERCELKKISVDSPDIKVIKRDRTYATVREIWNTQEDVLKEGFIDEIYNDLIKLTNVDEAVKQAHIDHIKEKYKKEKRDGSIKQENKNAVETELAEKVNIEVPNVESELVCPRCGAELVLRTSKKGDNAGNQFYGCSKFPKCRYVKNII